MQVIHILREKGRDIVTIAPEATLAEAARLLARKRIGALLIRDQAGGVAGILSERDVVRAISEESVPALGKPVSAYMTREVLTCTHSDSIDELRELMTHRRFRHVPVLEAGKLVGIISIGDVVKSYIAEAEREAENLREYIATG
ncbi:MAG TPA: CBS domain-containing protein [Rhizomicrobium sp.]|jgi:CBS domain-containing protein|nr:CBS domain-containing protein [Rhizomicrobium sp.]